MPELLFFAKRLFRNVGRKDRTSRTPRPRCTSHRARTVRARAAKGTLTAAVLLCGREMIAAAIEDRIAPCRIPFGLMAYGPATRHSAGFPCRCPVSRTTRAPCRGVMCAAGQRAKA